MKLYRLSGYDDTGLHVSFYANTRSKKSAKKEFKKLIKRYEYDFIFWWNEIEILARDDRLDYELPF